MNRVANDSTPAGTSFLSPDGTRIEYERRGTGPALILVHGGFVDRGFWGPSLPLLAEHFTVYALDRRGHGQSDPYPADHNLEREYEDVAALVAAADTPIAVLGHSSGAIVAMHAAKRVARVSHLVLYEPPRFDAFTSAVQGQLRVSLAASDYDQLLATVLVDVVVGTTNPELLRHAREQVLAGARQAQVWAASLRNVQSIPAEVDSYVGYRFDPKEFRDFNTPTAILLGSTSPPVVRRWMEDLHAALPASRIVELEGQGHGAMLEAPELFVRTVRAALEASSD
jgi:pimeloyl-ACP methyl ester carboxylesterase